MQDVASLRCRVNDDNEVACQAPVAWAPAPGPRCRVIDDDEAMVEMWRSLLEPWSVEALPLVGSCPEASAREALADLCEGGGVAPDLVLVRADLAVRGERALDRGRREWAGLALARERRGNACRSVPVALYGVLAPEGLPGGVPFVRLPDDGPEAKARLQGLLSATRTEGAPRLPQRLRAMVDLLSCNLERVAPSFLALCDARGCVDPTLQDRARAFWEGVEWKDLRRTCRTMWHACRPTSDCETPVVRLRERVENIEAGMGALEWVLPRTAPDRLPGVLDEYREQFEVSRRIIAAWMGSGEGRP